MKHKTNYLFLIFVILLAGWVVWYMKDKINTLEIDVSVIQVNRENIVQDIELEQILIGNLSLKYSNKVINRVDYSNYSDFTFHKILPTQDHFGKMIKTEKLTSSIYFTKDGNPKNLPLSDWLDENARWTARQAPTPSEQKDFNLAGEPAHEDVYDSGFQISYYNVRDIYIAHGTDIYEIWGYKLPDTPDPALTPEDIQSAREYEQIFNQILESMKFVY